MGTLRRLVPLFVTTMLIVCMHATYAAEVLASASKPRETYYKGEELVVRISVMNNASTVNMLNVTKISTTIWRVEKRYKRWRNVESVYNSSRTIGILIKPGQVFSAEVRVKLDFQPARYNLTVVVITKFVAGGGSEKKNYVIRGFLFWVKSPISIPPVGWAVIADAVLLIIAWFVYRRIR